MNKSVYLSGILAALLFAIILVSGAIISPDVSVLRDSVGSLTSIGASYRGLYDWLFTIYGLSLLVFSVGMAKIWQVAGNKKMEYSGTLLIIYSMTSLAIKYFHMDEISAASTLVGNIYLVLVAISIVTALLAIFFGAFGFGEARGLGLESFSLLVGTFVAGSNLYYAMGNYPQYYGLFERITLGGLVLWVFVVALDLFILQNKSEKRAAILQSAR